MIKVANMAEMPKVAKKEKVEKASIVGEEKKNVKRKCRKRNRVVPKNEDSKQSSKVKYESMMRMHVLFNSQKS